MTAITTINTINRNHRIESNLWLKDGYARERLCNIEQSVNSIKHNFKIK